MKSPPLSVGKGAEQRIRDTILPLPGSSRNLVNPVLLDDAAALARGGGEEGDRGWGQRVARPQPTRGRTEGVGGEIWRRSMGVWSWRIREVLPEITLLLVCPKPLLCLAVSPLFLLPWRGDLILSHRLMLVRTHLFGLASYFPRLRFNRYRCNSALSAQYYHIGAERLHSQQSRQHFSSASGRKAVGGHLPRNCNLGLAYRRKEIF